MSTHGGDARQAMSDGEGAQEFPPTGGDFISYVIVALVGVGLAFHTSRTLGGLATAGFVAVGVWWWMRLARRRLVVAGSGIDVHTAFGSRHVSWHDAYYTYTAESLDRDFTLGDAVLDGLVISAARAAARQFRRHPRRYATYLEVHGPRTSIRLRDYEGAVSAEARVLSTIRERGASETSPLEVRPEGLSHRGKLLPFAELDRVIVDDEFVVKKVGQRSMWASCRLGAVHNLWLLIELLRERGVTVELRFEPPPSIKASIEAAIAQHSEG
jgi:hypothetical protein